MLAPPDVTALSDEELPARSGSAAARRDDPAAVVHAFTRRTGDKPKATRKRSRRLFQRPPIPSRINQVLQRRCRCAIMSRGTRPSCWKFLTQDERLKDQLITLRRRLERLHKQDADAEAPHCRTVLLSLVFS